MAANVFVKLAEMTGSHESARSMIATVTGRNVSPQTFSNWCHNRRPAPAAACNAALHLIGSPHRVPVRNLAAGSP